MSFAECDGAANQLSGARDDKQAIPILFDFWSLVRVVRIFNGEIMQLELPLHTGQKRHVWFMQTNPHHMARLAAPT